MVKSYCRFCWKRDDIANLVEVCECHKKSDNALCHRVCLEDYISRVTQSEDDPTSNSARLCPNCKQPFRVKLKWKWSWERCCSGVSLGQYFNLTMIILSSLGFFVSVVNVMSSGDLKTKKIKTFTWIMVLIVAIMTLVVFRKIYDRWKRHQMDAELIDIV